MFGFHNGFWRKQHEFVFAQGPWLKLPRPELSWPRGCGSTHVHFHVHTCWWEWLSLYSQMHLGGEDALRKGAFL